MPLPPPLPRSAPPTHRFPWASVGLGGLILLLAAFQLLRPHLLRPTHPAATSPTAQRPERSRSAPPEPTPATPAGADMGAAHQVYAHVEQMPQPPGGMKGLMQYLGQNIHYPDEALRQGVEGKVFINFTIGPDGGVRDVRVAKGIGAGCDEEAVRVLRQMPPWQPGRQHGRLVSMTYTVPLTFSIARPSIQSIFHRLFHS